MAPRTKRPPFADPDVASVFDGYSKAVRTKMLALRALIFDTAAKTDGVGTLEETLKWGQPSYLTSETKNGTTVRIDALKDAPGQYALFVHCQTNLVDTFKELYPDAMTYVGNRAIHFDAADELPEDALRHCIGLALTYHRNKVRKHL